MKSFTEISGKSKLLFVAVLGSVFVATCATDAPKTPVVGEQVACDGSCPLPGGTVKVEEQVMAQENWSFTLPDSGWIAKEPPIPEIKVAMSNDNQEMMIFFVKDEAHDTFPEYVVGTIRAFAEGGALVNSIKQVKIGQDKFILAQLSEDGEVIWAWITAKDGYGYVLTCGGVINVGAGASQHDLCQSVANSLQIK